MPGTKSGRDLPPWPPFHPLSLEGVPEKTPPPRPIAPRPSLPRAAGLRRFLLRGGARGGNAGGRDPDTAQGPPWAEGGWGSLRARTVWKDRGGSPLSPICRAVKLGRAARARCRRKGPPTAFQPARSGFSPPAKSFVWKRTVRLCAGVCPPPPPTSTPSANFPFFLRFSLLFGWVITGSSCLACREELLPGSCVCGPSRQQTGRFPPTSPGPRPLPSGVIAWPWHARLSFPFRPQLSPEDFDSHTPTNKI